MIHVTCVPSVDYDVCVGATPRSITVNLSSQGDVVSWLNVEVDEIELRKVLMEFLYQKFRPVMLNWDGREARLAALLWLRQLLNDDGRFPPTKGTDAALVVEPERN